MKILLQKTTLIIILNKYKQSEVFQEKDLSSETMKAFFSAPRKFNLGYSVSRCSIYRTVLKNFLNKNGKTKHVG